MKLGMLFLILISVGVSTYADESDHIAVLTIMGEAANQSIEGQTAVGEVIRNRVKQRLKSNGVNVGDRDYQMSYNWWVERVVYQPFQFSFWNKKEKAYAWLAKHGTGEAYQRASLAWERSENSRLTNGATHYFAYKQVKPYWAKSMRKMVRLGEHDFYKETQI